MFLTYCLTDCQEMTIDSSVSFPFNIERYNIPRKKEWRKERKCNIDHVISNKIKYKKRGKRKEKDVKGKRMEERMKKKTGNERSMDY